MASNRRHSNIGKHIAVLVLAAFLIVAVVAYAREAGPLAPPTQPKKPPMVLEVHALSQQIEKGDVQLVLIRASDGQTPIPDIALTGSIAYPSGESQQFNGQTDSQGRFWVAWPVPTWSEPGTVTVTVSGIKEGYTNGIGNGFFTILPTETVYIPYKGAITLNVAPNANGTVAMVKLEFNPPTTSGVFLFIEKPDGDILKAKVADPQVPIRTITPTFPTDQPGTWRFWAISNGVASSINSLTVPEAS